MKEEKKATDEVKKVDVSKLVSIIPPSSELRREEKRITEKRIRVRYGAELSANTAKLAKQLADMLGIKEGDEIEIVVAGKKRFVYKALVEEGLDPNIVYCYPD